MTRVLTHALLPAWVLTSWVTLLLAPAMLLTPSQRVQGMASGGQHAAGPQVLLDIPRELTVPGTHAVVVIHLAVVDAAQQTLVEHGSDHGEVSTVTALETDSGLYAGCADGVADRFHVFVGNGDGLFDYEVFFCAGCGNCLLGMLGMRGANVDHVDVGIGQQGFVVRVRFQRNAILGFQCGRVVFSARADRADLCSLDGFEGLDMGAGNPPQPDDSNS